MEFYNKLESFFYQLQFGLTIDPDGYFIGERTISCLMLPPEKFFNYKSQLKFDYPFNPQKKISELYTLFINERITLADALVVIKELKTQYWQLLPSLTVETEQILKVALRKEFNNENEINMVSEINYYISHLDGLRNDYLEKLTNKLTNIDTNQNDTEVGTIGQYNIDAIKAEIELIKDFFIIESDITKANVVIQNYFLNSTLNLNTPFLIKKGNKKKISRCLGQIYRLLIPHEMLTYDYLMIYPKLFNCFTFSEIDINKRITDSKLYKYSMG